MSEIRSRRRSSDQRNVLYHEPSQWSIFAVIGLVVLLVAAVLAMYFLT